MRIRLISMNKVAALQRPTANGDDWEIIEVRPGSTLEPGVYPLFDAIAANRSQQHFGLVLYKYDGVIYQQTPAGIVRHPVSCFETKKTPPLGQLVLVTYESYNRATFVIGLHPQPQRRKLKA